MDSLSTQVTNQNTIQWFKMLTAQVQMIKHRALLHWLTLATTNTIASLPNKQNRVRSAGKMPSIMSRSERRSCQNFRFHFGFTTLSARDDACAFRMNSRQNEPKVKRFQLISLRNKSERTLSIYIILVQVKANENPYNCGVWDDALFHFHDNGFIFCATCSWPCQPIRVK